jgi:hypothetical protein
MDDRPGLHAERRTRYAIRAHCQRLEAAPRLSKVEEQRLIEEYLRTRGATICPTRYVGATVQNGRPVKTASGGQDLNHSAVQPRFIERGFE